MSGPWEQFAATEPKAPLGPWADFAPETPLASGQREGHGVWDSLVAGAQGTGSAMLVRGKLADVVLDPHHAKWYEKLLSSAAAIATDAVPEIAGAIAGGAAGTAVAPGLGTAIGGGAGAMAVPTEIREALARAYQTGEADSSTSFLGRVGIVIKGLGEAEVLKATAKDAVIGGATMGAGKFVAPLGRLASLGAEVGTLGVLPAALEGRLPEMEDFANAAILLGGMRGATSVASRLLKIYARTGVRPEQVVTDAQADPTIKEDLNSEPGYRVPTKEQLLAEIPPKEFGLSKEELDASMERLRAITAAKHAELGIDPEIPRAYQNKAIEENAKTAVPGEKAQQFEDQPFANIPQAAGEPTLPTHINYNYVNTSAEAEGALSRLSQLWEDKIQEQRRGEVPMEQTYAEAGEWLNRLIGGKDIDVRRMAQLTSVDHELGARILAKKQLAVGAAEDLMRNRKAYVEAPSDEGKLKFMASIERSATILGNFLGERAELGRAMQILKSTTNDAERSRQIAELVDRYKQDPEKLAIAMGALDEPGAALRTAKKAVESTTWDKLIEYWKAGLVSGPWTHAANLIGNATFMAVRPAVEQVASVMGAMRGADRIAMVQPLARVVGNINGAYEVSKMAAKIYQLEGAGGVVKAMWKAGSGSQKAEVASGGAIQGKWGEVVRSSFRALGAEDALFKTLNERGELYSLASKAATDEGLSPMSIEFWNRVGDIVSNPSDAQLNASKEAGLRLTFNLPLGEKGRAMQQFIRTMKLQWAAPFTQTPGNIAKEMVRMTPFAPFIGEWREAFAKGGSERDKAIAELAIGSALMTGTMALFFSGKISGGSDTQPGKRNVNEAAGRQPYSVEINGKWYDYSRIQPIGTIVGLAADMANAWDHLEEGENDKVPKILAVAFANAITNQTMLQGLTMFVNTLSEPDKMFPRMAQSYAASALPFSGLMRQSAEMLDKEQRRIDGIKDAVYAAVPILRERLLPKINPMTGEPMETKGRIAGQKVTEEAKDKVLSEAARLGVGVSKAPTSIQLPSPDRKIGKVELTPEQQNIFASESGKMAHKILEQLVSSPMWDGLPDLMKKKIYAKVFLQARKAGAAAALPAEHRAMLAQGIADQVQEAMTNE